jgi:membrane dipeptidase
MDRELKAISRNYERSEFEMARPPLDLLIDHIEHIAKVAGIDHVGLGSDFDGVTALPEGVQDCSDLPISPAASSSAASPKRTCGRSSARTSSG